MLEYYFKSPSRLRQLRCGPISEQLDGLAQELYIKGFRYYVGQRFLSIAGRLNIFASTRGIKSATEVDATLIKCFLTEQVTSKSKFYEATKSLQRLTDYLQQSGFIPIPVDENPRDPDKNLLIRYDLHLRDVRGLTPRTCEYYLHGAKRFLLWYRDRHLDSSLNELSGSVILSYITETFKQSYSIAWKRSICNQTRRILHYLRWEEIIDHDLERCVPKIPQRRLANIPRHLPWNQVLQLIDSVDIKTQDDKRDKAILLLIATLGLRNSELRSLRLSNIDWRANEIHLPRTKTRRERVLPLLHNVGEVLADYILNSRPKVDIDAIILNRRAPIRPISESGVIYVIKNRLENAGIKSPSNGAHMLRHSLATHMVNIGIPITEIANILGHVSINTTAIYTKVDITHLTKVALPFWKGGNQ